MKDITIRDAEKLSAPNPFGLVVSADGNGKPNLMAISWWTYASNNPATLVICISGRGYSHELISAGGAFTLCLVDESIKEAAFACGTCSGRTVDKAEKFGIELEPSALVAPPYVRQSRVAFECKVTEETAAGDHVLYIAQVVAVHGDESRKQLYALDGYARVGTV